ncbi:MAG: DUF5691 domain-containing protein, partial [Planctomycetota bacterium]
MPDDLLVTLQELKKRWMIGGAAIEKLPERWSAIAQSDPSPDAALLAVAGQALQFAVQPVPGDALRTLSPLPQLALPVPPTAARQQIRNLTRVVKLPESQMLVVLEWMANRGYVVHPADYMPTHCERLPDVYAPWVAWQRAEEIQESIEWNAIIDANNWDEWMPAGRRGALDKLRRSDPSAARKLLMEKLASLPAEERFRVVESWSELLSSEDQALLEKFAKDRSGKVRQLIQQYFARIGAVEHDADEVSEYADFFHVAKHPLRAGHQISAKRLKTDAQKRRRSELCSKLSLSSMAQGLGMSSEADLVDGWEHVDVEASDSFVHLVAATGSQETSALLAGKISTLDGIGTEAFQELFNRLNSKSRMGLLPQVMAGDESSFVASILCTGGIDARVPFDRIKSLRPFKELKQLAEQDNSDSYVRQ